MDIGTAKPSPDLRAEIPHHLIDIVEPQDAFSVAEFQRAGRAALADAERRRAAVIVAGGSGLHYRSLLDPLEFPPTDDSVRSELEALPVEDRRRMLLAADPAAAHHVDLANPRRVLRALEIVHLTGEGPSQRAARPAAQAVRQFEAIRPFDAIGIDAGAHLPERARQRFDAMLDAGLLSEVEGLADDLGPTARQAVGYKELLPVVRGEADLATGRRAGIDATTSLAGRQRTYFRKDPRISWIPWHDEAARRLASARQTLEHAWIS